MARSTTRRSPRLEILEGRQLLSTAEPTAAEQYTLELVNEARTDPQAASVRVQSQLDGSMADHIQADGDTVAGVVAQIADAPARPPVAWNGDLAAAATAHSADLLARGVVSHYGPHGETPTDRAIAAGYSSDPAAIGENVIVGVDSPGKAMAAFLADYGNPQDPHRQTIQQDNPSDSYRDAGVALVPYRVPVKTNPFDSNPGEPSIATKYAVTQVFGRQDNAQPQILGVVHDDPNHNDFYDVGEGVGGATITVTKVDSGTPTGDPVASTTTWGSGGYQVPVAPGNTYEVKAEVNGQTVGAEQVQVGSDNVKVDFVVPPAGTLPAPAVVDAGRDPGVDDERRDRSLRGPVGRHGRDAPAGTDAGPGGINAGSACAAGHAPRAGRLDPRRADGRLDPRRADGRGDARPPALDHGRPREADRGERDRDRRGCPRRRPDRDLRPGRGGISGRPATGPPAVPEPPFALVDGDGRPADRPPEVPGDGHNPAVGGRPPGDRLDPDPAAREALEGLIRGHTRDRM